MPIDRQAMLARLNAYCTAFNLTPPPVDFDSDGRDVLSAFCAREGVSLHWLLTGEGRAKPGLLAHALAALDRMTDKQLNRALARVLEHERAGGCLTTTLRRHGIG